MILKFCFKGLKLRSSRDHSSTREFAWNVGERVEKSVKRKSVTPPGLQRRADDMPAHELGEKDSVIPFCFARTGRE